MLVTKCLNTRRMIALVGDLVERLKEEEGKGRDKVNVQRLQEDMRSKQLVALEKFGKGRAQAPSMKVPAQALAGDTFKDKVLEVVAKKKVARQEARA